MSKLKGRRFGPYQLNEEIGKGGMATVYRAKDRRSGQIVAVKVMLAELQEQEEFVKRFKREAGRALSLKHPHILRVLDGGMLKSSGQLFMVTPWISGGTLKEYIERSGGSLPPGEVNRILKQIASALDHAHQQGIVHRDIKPANIMLTGDGQAILADFGIAKAAHESRLTVAGSSMGTPVYMAPEQILDRGVGPCTDIYALGVTIYQALSGRPPFLGQISEVMRQHVKEPPAPLKMYNAKLPETLDPVMAKAMAKAPSERYASAGEFAAHFQAALPAQLLKTKQKFLTGGAGRRSALPIVGGGLVLLLLLLAALGFIFGPEFFNRAEETPPAGNSAAAPPTQTVALVAAEASQTATASSSPTPADTSKPPTGTPALTPNPAETPTLSGLPTTVSESVAVSLQIKGPEKEQVFASGSDIILSWSGAKLGQNDRYRIALRNDLSGHIVTAPDDLATTNVEYTLPDLEAGTYTWLALIERKEGTVWQILGRSERRIFIVERESAATEQSQNAPATSAPPPTPTQPVALRGNLAFSLRQGTQYKVYILEMGNSPPTQVKSGLEHARQPAFNSDGTWLLLNGTGGGNDAIIRVRADGSQRQDVTCLGSTAESARPSWSPDGQSLVFDGLGADPANPQLYIHRLDEAACNLIDRRFLIDGGSVSDSNGLYPLWGANNRLYFRSCATWNPEQSSLCGLWSARVDGTAGANVKQETDNPNHLPTDVDQTHLLFMSSHEQNWEVYSLNLQQGGVSNISRHPGADVWGTISPDGQTVAFMSNRGGGWAIWLMDIDGQNPRPWFEIAPTLGEVEVNQLSEERMSWR